MQPPRPDRRITSGDLFASGAQTLVNAVNCVGVMGAGIAKAFRDRYPDMFADYKARCDAGEVQLGEPYLWAPQSGQWVLNFPTKQHWREPSELEPIRQGLDVLASHYTEWGIESLAVPALGCGLGGLPWDTVRPVLIEGLARLDIPVLLYRPA